MQGSEISTPYSSVTSLSEDTLQYLDTHQHLLPGAKRPSNASRSRVASLRHSVCLCRRQSALCPSYIFFRAHTCLVLCKASRACVALLRHSVRFSLSAPANSALIMPSLLEDM